MQTEQATSERYLNYEQATRYTGLSKTTIWRAYRNGELVASEAGRGIRFDIQELDKWMETRA